MSIIAVQRALIILKAVAASPDGVAVRELARSLGYSPAVVQKSLQTMVSQGFAQQDPTTQRYHLGPAALQVGLAGLAQLEVRDVARPHLQALSQATGETALLGVRRDSVAIYVDKVVSLAEVRTDAPLGAARPYNCTAVGKALLAYMSAQELERLSQSGAFVSPTPNSATDLTRIQLELAHIRERGLAVDKEEFVVGAMCLAAPIRNYEGAVVAACALTGPVQRIEAAQEDLARQVIACGQAISAALGRRAP